MDIRTKLIMLLLCILSTAFLPELKYEFILILLLFIVGIFSGVLKYSAELTIAYCIIYGFSILSINYITGNLTTSFIAFFALLNKVYPCIMMAGLIIKTTKVSEFISGLYKIKVPRNIIIPLAVMMRYIPVIEEDRRFIKDAMKMRNISPSIIGFIKKPMMNIECIYVPLLLSASKTADELTIACVTRGIENPNPRTCLENIRFRLCDFIVFLIFVLYLIFLILKGR
ncbi:MAG: energy-coupling factor transporter transmembrane protein EcfT [Clostridium sp.]|uniref:energy-coupling factor transporter transmembrane component T n=1 Tax=Clostridium sp. TaxID=1506 RepID=UPI0025BCC6FE|nr:energy-coupling factor transporter transmembrane component T [Clostridium sp.]MCH3963500.1 energy-coupling factor transporter transmembrane protein EcfT [Clostridium sp.]MCI1869714.1 energy-coupling factor transporter transmembrane protein EcfT [Clostridium sp.]